MKRRSFLRRLLSAAAVAVAAPFASPERFVPYGPGCRVAPWSGWLERGGEATGFVRTDGTVWRFPGETA